MYWYASQTMYVRWSGILSHGFHVANGVRQGGILSPFLFNVYIDDLSIALSACHTGCYVSNTIMNHFMYADDLTSDFLLALKVILLGRLHGINCSVIQEP